MRFTRLLALTAVVAILAFTLTGCSSGSAAASVGSSANAPAGSAATVPQAAAAAASIPQTGAATIQLGTGNFDALIADYDRRCKSEPVESLECEALRSLLVARVTTSYLRIEASGDQRATKEALSGLDLIEEPQILIAAMRVLGHFPETPNLAAKVVPLLLDSPYIRVQNMAADVLIANPDAGFQSLGRLWSDGHNELVADSPYDEYPDLPAHYDSMGFPKFAGSEWFSPGDSDRSIGWSTKDAVAAVAKWYGDTLHADVMNAEKWGAVQVQQSMLSLQMDSSKTTRMQQLMERILKGDQAASAEYEKLGKEMADASTAAGEAMEKGVLKRAAVTGEFLADARWIIAAKKGERISRLVVIFPIPAIQRTVIREVWDLTDYPSGWPAAAK